MRSIIGLAGLVAGVATVACLLVGARGGHECAFGLVSAACMGGSNIHLEQLLGLVATAAVIVAGPLTVSLVIQVRRHVRLASILDQTAHTTWLAGHEVALVSGLSTPYVAGLPRAQIYCPIGLGQRLSPDELRAVILHERHHQLAHAPFRLVLLAALRPAVQPLPGGRSWLERQRGAIEIAADDHALRSGARRPALARALLKLAAEHPDASFAGYASASDLRLRHLVGDESSGSHAPLSALVLPIPVVALVACLVWGLLR